MSAGDARAAITERHRRVHEWWAAEGGETPDAVVGLALAGGGIRSATFSLGLIQALARRGKLGGIDVMSTVSGGSYLGCFLRSLFLPRSCRGIAVKAGSHASEAELAEQHAFALRALTSQAGTKVIAGPGDEGDLVCNPIWWLREHSRYLAPNGPADFGYAAAYLTRNWAAMIYVFALAVALPLLLAGAAEALARDMLPAGVGVAMARVARAGLSPLLLLSAVPLLAALVLGLTYWLTSQMSANDPDPARQLHRFRATAGAVIAVAVVLAVLFVLTGPDPFAPLPTPPVRAEAHWLLGFLVAVSLIEITTGAVYVGRIRARLSAPNPDGSSALAPQLLTAELRLRLTQHLAVVNRLWLAIVALASVESAASALLHHFPAMRTRAGLGALLPVLAFAIKKLADGAGGATSGKLAAFVTRYLSVLALLLGVLLYGAVAVLVDMVVQHASWRGAAWTSPPDWPTFAVMAAMTLSLFTLTARTDGFINLSSWHNLYASRLIRAYLGASNVDRLRSVASERIPDATIRDNHALDYIGPALYSRLVLPAPVHVINATVNVTIDPRSQMISRDRKGEPVSVEPGGVFVGADRARGLVPWDGIGQPEVAESLSLGQWCAISGAAVAPAMGRVTSLGVALAASFANIRLGYWWRVPALAPPQRAWSRLFATFAYLKDEMTARYSRDRARQYLSDGGHFENTGAYALIRRRVPTIVVSDNGEDAGFSFADLERLVRIARLDLDAELRLLGGAALAAFRRKVGCEAAGVFVDPEADPDWKAGMRAGRADGFALACSVTFGRGSGAEHPLDLVLIKPRLVPGLPEDVLGYAATAPTFPQQSTGDQFFDEAQWESYRRLGEVLGERLIDACPKLFPAREPAP